MDTEDMDRILNQLKEEDLAMFFLWVRDNVCISCPYKKNKLKVKP